jgi:hypothetical protein
MHRVGNPEGQSSGDAVFVSVDELEAALVALVPDARGNMGPVLTIDRRAFTPPSRAVSICAVLGPGQAFQADGATAEEALDACRRMIAERP